MGMLFRIPCHLVTMISFTHPVVQTSFALVWRTRLLIAAGLVSTETPKKRQSARSTGIVAYLASKRCLAQLANVRLFEAEENPENAPVMYT